MIHSTTILVIRYRHAHRQISHHVGIRGGNQPEGFGSQIQSADRDCGSIESGYSIHEICCCDKQTPWHAPFRTQHSQEGNLVHSGGRGC